MNIRTAPSSMFTIGVLHSSTSHPWLKRTRTPHASRLELITFGVVGQVCSLKQLFRLCDRISLLYGWFCVRTWRRIWVFWRRGGLRLPRTGLGIWGRVVLLCARVRTLIYGLSKKTSSHHLSSSQCFERDEAMLNQSIRRWQCLVFWYQYNKEVCSLLLLLIIHNANTKNTFTFMLLYSSLEAFGNDRKGSIYVEIVNQI